MSDNAIRVGDLVVVVASHCGVGAALGLIRTVIALKANQPGVCYGCGYTKIHSVAAELDGPAPWGTWHIPLPYLRRVPPLWELDEAEHKEETPIC